MHYDFDINTHAYMDYRRQWAGDPMPECDYMALEDIPKPQGFR